MATEKQKGAKKAEKRFVIHILVCCDRKNLQLNESVVGAQLYTYRLHHQTSHWQAE